MTTSPETSRLVWVLQLFALVVFLVSLIGAGLFLILDQTDENLRKAVVALPKECEDSGGVLIRGTTESSASATQFSVCVPAEAFTCIDVE
jgi:hypothetical protein